MPGRSTEAYDSKIFENYPKFYPLDIGLVNSGESRCEILAHGRNAEDLLPHDIAQNLFEVEGTVEGRLRH